MHVEYISVRLKSRGIWILYMIVLPRFIENTCLRLTHIVFYVTLCVTFFSILQMILLSIVANSLLWLILFLYFS